MVVGFDFLWHVTFNGLMPVCIFLYKLKKLHIRLCYSLFNHYNINLIFHSPKHVYMKSAFSFRHALPYISCIWGQVHGSYWSRRCRKAQVALWKIDDFDEICKQTAPQKAAFDPEQMPDCSRESLPDHLFMEIALLRPVAAANVALTKSAFLYVSWRFLYMTSPAYFR